MADGADGVDTDIAAAESAIGFDSEAAGAGGWPSTDFGASDPDEEFASYDDADERTGEEFATAGAAD